MRRQNDGEIFVDLTIAITEFETKFGRQITGLCSGFLRSITCEATTE